MLSVVITSYDKPLITSVHVRECMNSTVMPDEIIVVNDGGDDEVKGLLQKLEKKTKLIYAKIHEDIPWNYNGACNLGVWLSKGDVLGFEDTDNIPHKNFYKSALEVLGKNPNVGRVIGKIRNDVSVKDIEKPIEEWEVIGSRGPNQGSYIMDREVYLKLKGQDERFCGRYGWMYYDWRRRMLGKAKIDFAEAGTFYYVVEGQCGLAHRNTSENYSYLKLNTREPHYHSEHGILNFRYSYETLH